MGALTRRAIGIAATLLTLLSWPALAAGRPQSRLDATLATRAGQPGVSRVIVRSTGATDVTAKIRAHRGQAGQRLALVDAYVAEVPNDALSALAAADGVAGVHLDRPVGALLTPGAGKLAGNLQGVSSSALDFTGAGVGVAVIDSGLTSWHDDLARVDAGRALVGQRVAGFADFTGSTNQVADSYGHGTHVAGIVAGSGHDSDGAYAGVAPGAHLLVLKVLDGEGRGYVSDVIRALEFAVTSRARFNLRVINLSIGAPVLESFETDPLTLAALRAVEAGLVVVAAAGNFGKNLDDQIQYGGVTAPGNAPWVLTVGAYSHMGTPDPSDDRVAGYSSRGPTAFDFAAKPDLVAPGTRIVSLNDDGSALALRNPEDLVAGTGGGAYPYLTLSGTSMAAPVVSGVVARMLQANPALTPNAVKAILQYTAAVSPEVDFLSQGAGFLNTEAAVSLARFYATSQEGDTYAIGGGWSRHIIWGNRRVSGGVLQPWGSAWGANIIWGSAGDNIIWGSGCPTRACDNIIWGSSKDNIIWGSSKDNIIWGSSKTKWGKTTSSGARPRTTSSGALAATTSSGAATSSGVRPAAAVTARTSSGDRSTRATTSFGAPAATTSSGAPATTSFGGLGATTSSGVRAATTSSGARRWSLATALPANKVGSPARQARPWPRDFSHERLHRELRQRVDRPVAQPAAGAAAAKLA